MKKIPTVFVRVFEEHQPKEVLNEFTSEKCRVAFLQGVATVKWDGACCAMIDGVFYKRYDAKRGKKPPKDAIPCCDPDPITGHWPHWVTVSDAPQDKWFKQAYENTVPLPLNGTLEALGPHFQNNPYGLAADVLRPHGQDLVDVERTYEGVKEWLSENAVEGLVFWLDGEPVCKIKRKDFGFKWPVREE